ncbi:hypothetical protein HPB48_015422 [Haemaphysalis longicornis]|uniref:Uncharacterized protein n=1 Tax=Haemaphysalis longicornis TaxID=44386 RepID=A0A9J6G8Z7_HAELO|nr:hypothetical protein HPB48_015422 [Haemaphysalis longicornis]
MYIAVHGLLGYKSAAKMARKLRHHTRSKSTTDCLPAVDFLWSLVAKDRHMWVGTIFNSDDSDIRRARWALYGRSWRRNRGLLNEIGGSSELATLVEKRLDQRSTDFPTATEGISAAC